MSFVNLVEASSEEALDPVLECLASLARAADRPSSPVLLRAGLALTPQGTLPFHQVEPALEQVGMRGLPLTRPLKGWPKAKLPAILELEDGRAIVLNELNGSDDLVFVPGTPEPMWVPASEIEPCCTPWRRSPARRSWKATLSSAMATSRCCSR